MLHGRVFVMITTFWSGIVPRVRISLVHCAVPAVTRRPGLVFTVRPRELTRHRGEEEVDTHGNDHVVVKGDKPGDDYHGITQT